MKIGNPRTKKSQKKIEQFVCKQPMEIGSPRKESKNREHRKKKNNKENGEI